MRGGIELEDPLDARGVSNRLPSIASDMARCQAGL